MTQLRDSGTDPGTMERMTDVLLSPAVHRLVQRTMLLSECDPLRHALYARFFKMTIIFGEVLHDLREALEIWMLPASGGLPALEDVVTWENGLLLPDDVIGPYVMPLLQWYASQAIESEDNALLTMGLATTLMYAELGDVVRKLQQ